MTNMKQILLTFGCLLAFQLAFSQNFTSRGNFMMGVAGGFSTNKSDVSVSGSSPGDKAEGPRATQWNVAPRIGYFLFDNFNLGIGLDYTFSRSEQPGADPAEDSDLLFGPFARAYALAGEDLAFFLEGSFGFGNSSANILVGTTPQNISTNITSFGVGPGFTVMSDHGVGLEMLLKYNFSRSKFDTNINGVSRQTTTNSNSFALSVGLQFYFGGFQRAGE